MEVCAHGFRLQYSYGSLYLLVGRSKFGGSGLSCDLTSFMELRTVGDFSVCSAFYYC